MSDEHMYECQKCKTRVNANALEQGPDCCGQPMRRLPLEQCKLASTAEHFRLDEPDEPCDDGRAG